MQRLFNISKWSHISSGKALEFAGDRPRKVVLETNSPTRVVLSILERGNKNGTVASEPSNRFLALVEGRDSIEFYVTGSFWIAATGGDCYIYTADGDGVTYHSLDAESFTVVRERRVPSPELEYITRVLNQNMNRRLQQQAAELEKSFSRRMGALAAQSAVAPVPAASVPDTVDPGDGSADGGAEAVIPSSDVKSRGRSARSS